MNGTSVGAYSPNVLEQFLLDQKMTVGAEGQSLVWYHRVWVNDVLASSPWQKLNPGDRVKLLTYPGQVVVEREFNVAC
jgi:hypothetical protein